MHKHKLIQCLARLSRKEMTRFRELVHSPFFNKHPEVKALIDYLEHIYPDLSGRRCDREKIFRVLFPGALHDQGRLAVLFTYAQRLLEQFLIQEALSKETPLQRFLLLRQLRSLKLYDQYERQLFREQHYWENADRLDGLSYYHRYELAHEADHYFTHIARRPGEESFRRKQEMLDHFYMAQKLKDAVEALVRRGIIKMDQRERLLDAVLYEVRNHLEFYASVPAVYLYYHLYLMGAESEHGYYHRALDILHTWEAAFPAEEKAAVYNYLQNYCIRQINRNEPAFLGELFRLYQYQLRQELLLEDGFLSEWHYKNIVTTGIRLGEIDWVSTFIEGYRERLPPASRDNAYRFNRAAYFHSVNRYDQVLALLTKVEYSDLRYSLDAKALLLRTYYDLEEDEALFSLVDSFRQFLHRNKLLADTRRNGYYQLFRLTRRAAQIRAGAGFVNPERTQRETARLVEDLRTTQVVYNKSWLEEKIRALQPGES